MLLDTDTSNVGVGAELSQMGVDGKEWMPGYVSWALGRPERNYCITRRELLAIIFGVQKFCAYLAGAKFTAHTDRSTLRWLLVVKEPEGQMAGGYGSWGHMSSK